MNRSLILLSLLSGIIIIACNTGGSAGNNTGPGASSGQSGSMARFQVVGDHLYTLSGSKLKVYNLDDPESPRFQNSVDIGRNIETLFEYRGALYIGSTTGMDIYDISEPINPRFQSAFIHVRSCDPVVVQDTLAYLTLRSGGGCGGTANVLQVIDVSNPQNPIMTQQYQMLEPHGLGIDGNTLFVCDGHAGLKVFDITNRDSLVLEQTIYNLDTYDLIASRGNLILMAEDGIYQYDYNNRPLSLLSKIFINSQL